MRRVLAAVVFVFAAVASAFASTEMEAACDKIKTEIRDCRCAVHFLERHLGAEQGTLLLRIWAASGGYLGDPSRAFAEIYHQHTQASALKASSDFLNVRTEFEARCRADGFLFFE